MTDNPKSEVLTYLSQGIKAELAAYVFYRTTADKAKTDEIKRTLLGFAEEEKKHFLALEKHHDSLIRSEKWVSYRDALKRDELPVLDEDIGEVHVNRLQQAQSTESVLEILKLALELEQAAFELYSRAAAGTDEKDVKKTFEFLSKFELGHVRRVEELIAVADG